MGVQQDLFFFHALSPGCAFFLPLGGRIYNTLIDYMREKYWEYEYEEVRERCNKRSLPAYTTGYCTVAAFCDGGPAMLASVCCVPRPTSQGRLLCWCALIRHAPTTAATVLAVCLRLCRPTSSTLTCGRPVGTPTTTGTTCLALMLRSRSLASSP